LGTKILREDMAENQHQTYQHVQQFYVISQATKILRKDKAQINKSPVSELF
jgi:hypothetical protein